MTPEEIIAKLAAKPKKQRKRDTGGQFEGKQGTIRRSRKGTPRRQANGGRYYVPTLAEWQACGLCLSTPE